MKGIWDRRIVSLALVALLAGGCAYISKATKVDPQTEPEVVVIEGRDDEFRETCAARYLAVLERQIDPSGAETCLDLARRGYTAEQIDEWLMSSTEHTALLERKDREAREAKEAEERRKREEEEREKNRGQLRGRLRAEGQIIVDASGQPFVEPFASTLTLLTKSPAERAAKLDEVSGRGGRGVRVFAGRLTWANQTPASALQAIPDVLAETAARGLYLILDAITDSRDGGYDEEAHLRMVAALTAGASHVILGVANEPWHHSQSDRVQDLTGLCAMAQRVLADYPNLWLLGAGPIDYPLNGRYAGDCGPIWAAHLDRSGGPRELLARVPGLSQIAAVTGKPGISLEPIGAGEVTGRGRRADPPFFGDLAHQQASVNVTGVFHSEDGLHARPLRPKQKAAAEAFVAGYARPRMAIPVPPIPQCSQKRDPEAIVACQRASWGRMSQTAVTTFLRDVARDLNAAGVHGGPFGVLIKRSGNSCEGISCDIVCSGNGTGQRQWDTLTDSDFKGAQKPVWSVVNPIVVRTCEVVR